MSFSIQLHAIQKSNLSNGQLSNCESTQLYGTNGTNGTNLSTMSRLSPMMFEMNQHQFGLGGYNGRGLFKQGISNFGAVHELMNVVLPPLSMAPNVNDALLLLEASELRRNESFLPPGLQGDSLARQLESLARLVLTDEFVQRLPVLQSIEDVSDVLLVVMILAKTICKRMENVRKELDAFIATQKRERDERAVRSIIEREKQRLLLAYPIASRENVNGAIISTRKRKPDGANSPDNLALPRLPALETLMGTPSSHALMVPPIVYSSADYSDEEDEKQGHRGAKRFVRLPSHAKALLQEFFRRNINHPYPNDAEKKILADRAGLSVRQISNWLTNTRKRVWHQWLQKNGIEGSPVLQAVEHHDIPTLADVGYAVATAEPAPAISGLSFVMPVSYPVPFSSNPNPNGLFSSPSFVSHATAMVPALKSSDDASDYYANRFQ